jgi:hypothetical protein
MVSSGLLRRMALVRTDVSEEPGASFIRVTEIGGLGTTQAATSNRRTLRRNTLVFLILGQNKGNADCGMYSTSDRKHQDGRRPLDPRRARLLLSYCTVNASIGNSSL